MEPVLRYSSVPCAACGKRVKRRSRAGKARYRHNCPHGRPCPAGDPLTGTHLNAPRPVRLGGCHECSAAEIASRE